MTVLNCRRQIHSRTPEVQDQLSGTESNWNARRELFAATRRFHVYRPGRSKSRQYHRRTRTLGEVWDG
jgi:hypothetical protein